MSKFVIHYSQRSRWDGSATLHRAGCGKVPFEGMPGHKKQGVEISDEHAARHAQDAEKLPRTTYYKVCSCAKKALAELHAEEAKNAC